MHMRLDIINEFFNRQYFQRAELQESQDCADTHMAEARGGHWKRLRLRYSDIADLRLT